ncbi:unnamed protein product [Phytophthora fragariaefolia]|uniref:Unnamed protein product n=1 Tax=Phytophthora fragariaefolia TaxID=1490495 RepID=A0A9W6XYY9_9STRA|nr:unnamed protein product [Phytophthora fragariaefolia]
MNSTLDYLFGIVTFCSHVARGAGGAGAPELLADERRALRHARGESQPARCSALAHVGVHGQQREQLQDYAQPDQGVPARVEPAAAGRDSGGDADDAVARAVAGRRLEIARTGVCEGHLHQRLLRAPPG